MDWTWTTTTCPATHRIAIMTVCFPVVGPTPNRRPQHCMCTSGARKNNHIPLTILFCCAVLETHRPAPLLAQSPAHVPGLASRRQISNTTPKLRDRTGPLSFASTARREHNRSASGKVSRCRRSRVLSQSFRPSKPHENQPNPAQRACADEDPVDCDGGPMDRFCPTVRVLIHDRA